jgi:glycosyltransferase involved in cell wall biosynthesis
MSGVDLSVVIPTFNERDSIAPLLAELAPALDSLAWEAVFVDDSCDGTDQLIAQLAQNDPRLRLLHRAENRGGLAGAVVEGLGIAQGTYVCVLDADLQHPPARIPEMLAEAQRTHADVVIASRYVPGGSAGGLASPTRQFFSHGLKRLSALAFPRRLAGVSDPLGGYFLVDRAIFEGADLRPIGYKILLEILVRCHWHHAHEVPYTFQPRRHGQSKADLRQGLRFLHHLAILFWDCSPVCAVPRFATGSPFRRQASPVGSRS